MGLLDEFLSGIGETYDTLSGNERIKQRAKGYGDAFQQGLLSALPILAKQPQDITPEDAINSGLLGAIKVFHGSPHKFDAFDMSKIGTGEGAQAYGHGLYFAESPEVANQYAQTLSKNGAFDGVPQYEIQNGIMGPEYMINEVRKNTILAGNNQRSDRFLDNEFLTADDAVKWLTENKKIPEGALIEKVGDPGYETTIAYGHAPQLYETSLEWPDPAREAADPLGPQHFLDWDKPLHSQSNLIKEKLPSKIEVARQEFLADIDNPNKAEKLARLRQIQDALAGDRLMTGADAYHSIVGANKSMADKSTEYLLNDLGIPGIRYLDGGSRSAGDGSYNYVVFDDKIPRIVKRNGLLE